MTTIKQKISMAASYKDISHATLARSIGMSPSNFGQKLKRETLSEYELHAIAQTLGAKYCAYFEFPDGTRI